MLGKKYKETLEATIRETGGSIWYHKYKDQVYKKPNNNKYYSLI